MPPANDKPSTTPPQAVAADLAAAEAAARHFQESGYFSEARDFSKAVTKIIFGRSLGLDPLSAMTHIIIGPGGKPQLDAHAMARLMRASGKFRWTIDESKAPDALTLTLYEKVDTGPATWEWFKHEPITRRRDEYKHLFGKNQNWHLYPRNMIFARLMTDVSRMYAPETCGGAYLPDELPGGVGVDGGTLLPLANDTAPGAKLLAHKAASSTNNSNKGVIDVDMLPSDVQGLRDRMEDHGLAYAWAVNVLRVNFVWADLTPDQVSRLGAALDRYEELHPLADKVVG